MSDPVIDPSDLGIYLNDNTIDTDRALALIADSQALCESIVSPLPTGADVVVKRVAGRAYVTTTSARQIPAAAGGFGQAPTGGGGMGGVYLTRSDKADLRRLAGGGGAFTIDMLPADFVAPYPFVSDGFTDWDQTP